MKSQIAELQQKLLEFCVAEIPVDEKIVTVFDGSLSGKSSKRNDEQAAG